MKFGSKQHLTNQCVYFAFYDYCHFWGPFAPKKYFDKDKFSNEIF